jgi:acetyltransferase-like isoleucine patch superfamily enzyme
MRQIITDASGIPSLKLNKIIGNFELINSKVIFDGENNVLFTGNAPVRLKDTVIHFSHNNSLVFIDNKQQFDLSVNILCRNDTVFCLGKDAWCKTLKVQCHEQKSVIIGNNSLIATDCRIENSDHHMIYDINNGKPYTRMNLAKHILIGDHVWLGKNSVVLKGTMIGSGAIIGTESVLPNKVVPSNSAFAGNPAKLVRTGVCFDSRVSHTFTASETANFMETSSDEGVFSYSPNETVPVEHWFDELQRESDVLKRLDFIRDFWSKKAKNRFFIS